MNFCIHESSDEDTNHGDRMKETHRHIPSQMIFNCIHLFNRSLLYLILRILSIVLFPSFSRAPNDNFCSQQNVCLLLRQIFAITFLMQTKNNHKKNHTNTNIRFSRQQTLLKQSNEIWINLLQRNRDFEHSTCPIDCLCYDGNGCSIFAYTTHSGTITIILQICENLNFTKESTRWTTIHDNAFSSHKKNNTLPTQKHREKKRYSNTVVC